ncbi:MAG: tetratricopeptide repeat protein [Phycisphaerae bacterium]
MAAKLNKTLVGTLTLVGMLGMGVVGFLLIHNLPGADPTKFEADAKACEEKGDWEAAAANYVRAMTFDRRGTPTHKAEWLTRAAKCYYELGNFDHLRELTTRARLLDPRLVSAQELLVKSEYELARTIPGAGTASWKVVLDEAKRLIELDPKLPIGLEASGAAYLKLTGEDSAYKERGEKALQAALQINPVNINAVTALADFYYAEQRGAEAEQLVNTAIEKAEAGKSTEEAAKLHVYRGQRLMFGGKIEDAGKDFKAAEALMPKLVDSHLAQARYWIIKGRDGYENAITALKHGVEADPANGEPYLMLASIYNDSKRPEEELKALEQGLEGVKKGKGFRFILSNYIRILLMKQALLNRLRAAEITPAKRDECLKAAQEWVDKAAGEVGPDMLDVRLMKGFLMRAKGEIVQATHELEEVDKTMGRRKSVEVKWLLSDLYVTQNQNGAAVEALRDVITENPRATMAYLRLAATYIRMGDHEAALRVLTSETVPEVARELQTNQQAALYRSECYRALGLTSKIEEERKAFESNSAGDRYRNAQLLAVQGRSEEAEKLLRDMLAEDGKNVGARVLLAQILLSHQDEAGARKAVDDGLAIDPENRGLRQLQLGLRSDLDAETRKAKMIEFINEEKDPFTRSVIRYNFHFTRDEMKEAKVALDEAEKLNPSAPQVIDQQFNFAVRAKDWASAERYAQKDAEINSDGTKGRLMRGRLALAKGEYAQAITVLNEGLAEYPANADGWVQLATAYFMNKQVLEARNAADRAVKYNPSHPMANRILGVLNLRAGKRTEARKNLELAAKFLPNDQVVKEQIQRLREEDDPASGIAPREQQRKEHPDNLENLSILARLYAKLKQADKADDAIKAAVALNPKDPAVVYELAMIYGKDLERPEEGEAILRAALQKAAGEEEKSRFAMAMGQYYQVLEMYAPAERQFLLAAKLNPTTTSAITVGEYYAQVNRPAEALDWFEKARNLAKADPSQMQLIHQRIVQLLIIMRDKDRIEKEIDAYIAAYPSDEQGRLFRGFYYLQLGDVTRSEQAFKQQLELQPDSAMALWQLGQIHLLRNRWQLAIDELQRAKAFKPNAYDYEHRVSLARALIGSGRFDDGVAELQAILKDAPDRTGTVLTLLDVLLSAKPPHLQEAENIAYTYMRRYPEDGRWPAVIGRVGMQSGDLNKAVDGYMQAVRASRFATAPVLSLLTALEAAQRYDDVIEFVTNRLPPSRRVRLPIAEASLAKAYASKKQMEEAAKSFQTALARARDDYESYRYVARAMAEALGPEKALEQAKAQADAAKGSGEPLKIYMQLLYINKKFDEALRVCDEIIKGADRDDDLTFGLAAQGIVLTTLKRGEEAVKKYETVLKLDPNYALVLNNIAYVLCDELKRPKEALPYAEQAETIAPKDPNTLDTLGWALAECGRLADAEGALLRAVDLDAKSVPALTHLGIVYKRMGSKDDARYRLQQAVASAKDSGDTEYGPQAEAALKELTQ